MTISPFSRPLYVMLKPVGARCNLACDYCYYLSKQQLYADERRHLMSEQLLEEFTRQYISAQTTDEVLFTWHGGEAMMRPLSFYQHAVELQKKYADGHIISNALQTNGTLITEEWARFLHDEHWLVGVSIDGPQEVHDPYRRTPQDEPTWARVRRGIDILNHYHVEWNAMAVVNNLNAKQPLEFYRFFRDDLQCRFLQFTPVVDGGEWKGEGGGFKVESVEWGHFLCEIFDEWAKNDVGEMFVQLFDATLANWVGVTPGVCTMAHSCGHAAVMEWNGDVYSCDHFVDPRHLLGNIREHSLIELMYGEQQTAFSQIKQGQLSDDCRQCPWLFACNGECPKNRILPGRRNYLCEGYRMFFRHVAPWMDEAARQFSTNS